MTVATAAVVADTHVINIIVVNVDENRHTDWTDPSGEVVVLPDGSPAGIGWDYIGDVFYPGMAVADFHIDGAEGYAKMSRGAVMVGPATYTVSDVTEGISVELDGALATVTATQSGQFTYTATDSLGRSASGTVTVTVP